jgi:hypothetical protein
MKKYNHLMSVLFSVDTLHENPEEVSPEELSLALCSRAYDLRHNEKGECLVGTAISYENDSYEFEEKDDS